jgi:NAD(P)-dependent dehydrogenase (short-subunit alcohol dehydrogenase family)
VGALDGHKTIVTGGGSGIGEAICRRFSAEGARVAVLDRAIDAAQAVANDIGGVAFECDVADAAAVEGAVGRVFDEFESVTDLVNNAGMGMNKPLHRYRDEEWALVMAVNSRARSTACAP